MELRPWQAHELQDDRPRKMIRADSRLGKTLVGARWITDQPKFKALIIAPLSVCPSWSSIIDVEGSREPDKAVHIAKLYSTASKLRPGLFAALKGKERQVTIINHDLVKTCLHDLMKVGYTHLVYDESHTAKSPGSQRGKSIRKLAASIPHIRLLTGTPAPNGPQDLWGQMVMINPTRWEKSFHRFSQKHLVIDTMNYNKVLGARDPEKLQDMFESDASIYRREDVFGPDTWQEVVREVELPQGAKDLYKQAVRQWIMEAKEDNISLDVNHTLSRMMRLQQLTSGFLPNQDKDDQLVHTAKIDAVLADLDDIITAGEKVVVFHRYTWEGNEYERRIKDEFSTKVLRLSGSTPTEQRAKDISTFNDGRGSAVYIVQTSAGGVGISLASATHAFFVSQYFSFDVERQARDRIYAPGKSRCVTYYRAVGTIDMYIANLLQYKRGFHEALSNSTIEGIASGIAPSYRDR